MFDDRIGYLIYLVVKFLAYSGWCYVGLRILRKSASWSGSLGYGVLRVVLGIIFGVSVFLAVGIIFHLDPPKHPVLLYLAMYIPIRFLEWSIMAAVIQRGAAERPSLGRRLLWVCGGIVTSHLADLPIILLTWEGAQQFLPVGRFLC